MIEVFLNVLVPVLIIFSLGYLLGRFFHIEVRALSTLSIYLLTPALVFQALYQNENIFSLDFLKIFAAVTIVIVFTLISVEIISRIFSFPRSFKIVLMLTLILSNSGNFGLPVNEYAFGKEGISAASLLLVIYVFYTHTLGVFLAASDKSDTKTALLGMLKVPVFYALALALILRAFHLEIPKQILLPIQSIGLSAIPLNLVLVGINLSQIVVKRNLLLTVSLISLAKLILIPIFAFFVLNILQVQGILFKTSMTQIAMPSAVYCSILASHYGSDGKLASEIVLVSLLLSIISLSGIIFMLLK
jgi:predicted permease